MKGSRVVLSFVCDVVVDALISITSVKNLFPCHISVALIG